MSEELQSGPVIIPLSAYNVGFGGGVSEEEVNELIENNLDSIKDQIDELSANAGSIEGVTTVYETAIGVEACGPYNGTAIGYRANGLHYGTAIGSNVNAVCGGTAIGYCVKAERRAVAIGYGATACDGTPIVIKAKNGDVTLAVTYEGKLLVNDNEIGAGSGSSIEGVTTNYETTIGVEANAVGGTAIGYRANGSGTGVAIGRAANGSGNGVAIGDGADGSSDGIAIGLGANGSYHGTAIGYDTEAGTDAVAIGYSAAANDGTVAIGLWATACADTRIVIKARNSCNNGDITLAVTDDGKLLVNDNEIGSGGSGSSIEGVTDCGNTALGKGATVCTHSTSIGYDVGGGPNSVAIGYRAKVDASSVVIGETATGDDRTVAIGYMANGQNRSVAIGYDADANYGTVAIGYEAKGCGDDRIVIKARNSCNNGDVTLKVTDEGKLLINDKEIGAGSSGGGSGSIEGVTDSRKTTLGVDAIGSCYSTAIGAYADGSAFGTAIGYMANGSNGGTAIGYGATACDGTPIVIKAKNGGVTLAVTYEGKLLVNGNEIGSGGSCRSIEGYTGYGETTIGKGTMVCRSSTVIGYEAQGAAEGVAIGYSAYGSDGVAIGYDVYGDGAVAIGSCTTGTYRTVAIGHGVRACGDNRIVIKARNTSNTGDITLAVTNDGKLYINDVEIGSGGSSSIEGYTGTTTVIGQGATACANSTVLGYNTSSTGGGVSIGYKAGGTEGGVAIGNSANGSYKGTAIGYNANGLNHSVAIGYDADANCGTVAIGYDANASGSNPIIIKAINNSNPVMLIVTDDGQLKINNNVVAFMSAISALQTCIDGLKSRLNALETA